MTYNINALLPIAETVKADNPLLPLTKWITGAHELFRYTYPALPEPAYDEWMAAFEQLEQESTAEDELSDLEDNGEPIPTPISCSMCQRPTTFDPTCGDLCFRCCRADSE